MNDKDAIRAASVQGACPGIPHATRVGSKRLHVAGPGLSGRQLAMNVSMILVPIDYSDLAMAKLNEGLSTVGVGNPAEEILRVAQDGASTSS